MTSLESLWRPLVESVPPGPTVDELSRRMRVRRRRRWTKWGSVATIIVAVIVTSVLQSQITHTPRRVVVGSGLPVNLPIPRSPGEAANLLPTPGLVSDNLVGLTLQQSPSGQTWTAVKLAGSHPRFSVARLWGNGIDLIPTPSPVQAAPSGAQGAEALVARFATSTQAAQWIQSLRDDRPLTPITVAGQLPVSFFAGSYPLTTAQPILAMTVYEAAFQDGPTAFAVLVGYQQRAAFIESGFPNIVHGWISQLSG